MHLSELSMVFVGIDLVEKISKNNVRWKQGDDTSPDLAFRLHELHVCIRADAIRKCMHNSTAVLIIIIVVIVVVVIVIIIIVTTPPG
jgi:t-SNARE complex subunit (syntaxin)